LQIDRLDGDVDIYMTTQYLLGNRYTTIFFRIYRLW